MIIFIYTMSCPWCSFDYTRNIVPCRLYHNYNYIYYILVIIHAVQPHDHIQDRKYNYVNWSTEVSFNQEYAQQVMFTAIITHS